MRGFAFVLVGICLVIMYGQHSEIKNLEKDLSSFQKLSELRDVALRWAVRTEVVRYDHSPKGIVMWHVVQFGEDRIELDRVLISKYNYEAKVTHRFTPEQLKKFAIKFPPHYRLSGINDEWAVNDDYLLPLGYED